MTSNFLQRDFLSHEAGVCGSLLLDGKCLPAVLEFVAAEDFQTELGRSIFEAAVRLRDAGETVDLITIRQAIKAAGNYDPEVAGELSRLLDDTPTAAHAAAYAKGMQADSRMRKATTLLSSAVMEHTDPDMLIDGVMTGLYEISRGANAASVSMRDAVRELVQWARTPDAGRGVMTGHSQLDAILGGLQPGNLVVLAARPSIGKSAFGCNIALDAAKQGVKTVVFSCEMSRLEITQRYVAREAWIDLDDVRAKKIFEGETARLAGQAVGQLQELPLYVYDNPGISVADMRRAIQSLRGVGLVVVDYIQLMTSVETCENRNLEVARISGALKRLAREFKIPILALSQLNRNKTEKDEPGLGDFRDSGAVEQDADIAIFLWVLDQPEDAPKQIGVKVAKNRMGRCGTVVMSYEGRHMRFAETTNKYTPPRRSSSRRNERGFKPYHDDDLPEDWR